MEHIVRSERRVYSYLVALFRKECNCVQSRDCAIACALCMLKMIIICHAKTIPIMCKKCSVKFQRSNASKLPFEFFQKLLQLGAFYEYPNRIINYFANIVRSIIVSDSIDHKYPHPGCIPIWEYDSMMCTLCGCFILFGYDQNKASRIATSILNIHETTDPNVYVKRITHNESPLCIYSDRNMHFIKHQICPLSVTYIPFSVPSTHVSNSPFIVPVIKMPLSCHTLPAKPLPTKPAKPTNQVTFLLHIVPMQFSCKSALTKLK